MRSVSPLITLIIGGLALAGCVSGKPKSDTYTDKSGVVQAVESDREVCEHSCNKDYSRCGDADSSRRSIDSTQNMFGGSASCKRSLSSCMGQCKGL